MTFNLFSIDSQITFDSNYIAQLSNYFEDIYERKNLDYIILKAGKDFSSLLNMSALFISRINYVVMPEEINNQKIKELFKKKISIS